MRKSLIKCVVLFQLLLCVSVSSGQDTSYFNKSTVPMFRNANSAFINSKNKAFIFGGNPTNDSISSIFSSENKGETWKLLTDAVNAELYDCSFPSSDVGYVVGDKGRMYKTTDGAESWKNISIKGKLASRNYRSVHFINDKTGIAVGGNQSNDAISTIIKTTDGGDNWSIIMDGLNPFLRDVFFIDDKTAWVVGDKGTLLKTTDGGDNWQDLSASISKSSRQLNSVYFISNQLGFIVGGNPSNDSIQTILKTTDAGQNWSVVVDKPNPMLNSVCMLNDSELYAVGDWGTILFSNDGGAKWNQVILDKTDSNAFTDVFFIDKNEGLITGKRGELWYYYNANPQQDTFANKPIISIENPVGILTETSVLVKGTVNPNNKETEVYFEYGTSTNFQNKQKIGTIYNGTLPLDFSATIDKLDENTFYYGFLSATNEIGKTFSDTVSFYTSKSAYPNFNFEQWEVHKSQKLNFWTNEGDVSKVSSTRDSFAAQIKGNGSEISAVLLGNVNDFGQLEKGIAFNAKPDSFSGWFNYDIHPDDSAIIYLEFRKNNGEVLANQIFYLFGNTNNTFKYHSFKIDYLSEGIPDSLSMAISCNNALRGKLYEQSVLQLDDVKFIGTNITLPNFKMESWLSDTRYKPTNWVSIDEEQNKAPYAVSRSVEATSGEYALRLSNIIDSKNGVRKFGKIQTGTNIKSNKAAFAVGTRHKYLFAQVQFYPSDRDSLILQVLMFKEGSPIGYGEYTTEQTIDQYQTITIPISYQTNTELPDSGLIIASIRKGINDKYVPASSYAIIDNFSFDGLILADGGLNDTTSKFKCNVYPNPVLNNLTIQFPDNTNTTDKELKILNTKGQIIYQKKLHEIQNIFNINTTGFPSGIYLVYIKSDSHIYYEKIIKK